MYFIALVVLGLGFRLLHWWFDNLQFSYLFLIEGAISGLGVAIGIYVIGNIFASNNGNPKFNPAKWYIKIIPYACGGIAVLLAKATVKIFYPKSILKRG